MKGILIQLGKEIDVGPLKSIGNPGRGLLSSAPDIALVMIFWDFTCPDVQLWKSGCLDETWEELVSLVQDASLYWVLMFAVLVINLLWEQDMQELVVVINTPGVAVIAIFNHFDLQKSEQNSARLDFCNQQIRFSLLDGISVSGNFQDIYDVKTYNLVH
jgi:hypothetical protein